MLLNMKEMLTVAQENKFAVPAFNIGSGQILRCDLLLDKGKRGFTTKLA